MWTYSVGDGRAEEVDNIWSLIEGLCPVEEDLGAFIDHQPCQIVHAPDFVDVQCFKSVPDTSMNS